MVFLWQHLHCATKHKISLIYNHLSPYGICSVHYSNIHSYGPRLHMARNEWPPSFPWTPLNKITIGPSIPLTFSLRVDRSDHCSDACKTRGSMCPSGLPRMWLWFLQITSQFPPCLWIRLLCWLSCPLVQDACNARALDCCLFPRIFRLCAIHVIRI